MIRDGILHPVFLQCCRLTVDKFWENIFEDLAYGITPYGSYINNDAVSCKTKTGAVSSVIIDKNNIQQTHDRIYNMFSSTLNILSPAERLETQNNFKKIEEDSKTTRVQWIDIKKKNIKDVLIDIFVVDMKAKHNISIQQARYLRSMIHTAMLFKAIDGTNINMDNGNITSIDGIYFKNKKLELDLDLYTSGFNEPVNQNDINIKSMSNLWDKYLIYILKKIEFSP
jgi:hypothetical protein